MTTDEFLASNPHRTYGYAVGYVSGREAARHGGQFAGLSHTEWLNAGDDYAHGYRAGYRDAAGLHQSAVA